MEDQDLLRLYIEAPHKLEEALAGLSESDLDNTSGSKGCTES